jgi:hypothetical protein
VRINWSAGSDNVTPQASLQYAVYKSTKNITSLAGAETQTLALPYSTNITTGTFSNLSTSVSYYFMVVVRDQAGNKAGYNVVSRTVTKKRSFAQAEPNTGFTSTSESGTFQPRAEPRREE